MARLRSGSLITLAFVFTVAGCQKSSQPADPKAAAEAAKAFTSKDEVFSGLSFERAKSQAASLSAGV